MGSGRGRTTTIPSNRSVKDPGRARRTVSSGATSSCRTCQDHQRFCLSCGEPWSLDGLSKHPSPSRVSSHMYLSPNRRRDHVSVVTLIVCMGPTITWCESSYRPRGHDRVADPGPPSTHALAVQWDTTLEPWSPETLAFYLNVSRVVDP